MYIKVFDQENGHEYLWDKNKFLNRQVHMQEAYQIFDQTGKVPNVEKVKKRNVSHYNNNNNNYN